MSKNSTDTLPLFMVEVVAYAGDVVVECRGPFSQLQAGRVAREFEGSTKVYPAIRRATAGELEALPRRLRKVSA
jgi:hypothetical protein